MSSTYAELRMLASQLSRWVASRVVAGQPLQTKGAQESFTTKVEVSSDTVAALQLYVKASSTLPPMTLQCAEIADGSYVIEASLTQDGLKAYAEKQFVDFLPISQQRQRAAPRRASRGREPTRSHSRAAPRLKATVSAVVKSDYRQPCSSRSRSRANRLSSSRDSSNYSPVPALFLRCLASKWEPVGYAGFAGDRGEMSAIATGVDESSATVKDHGVLPPLTVADTKAVVGESVQRRSPPQVGPQPKLRRLAKKTIVPSTCCEISDGGRKDTPGSKAAELDSSASSCVADDLATYESLAALFGDKLGSVDLPEALAPSMESNAQAASPAQLARSTPSLTTGSYSSSAPATPRKANVKDTDAKFPLAKPTPPNPGNGPAFLQLARREAANRQSVQLAGMPLSVWRQVIQSFVDARKCSILSGSLEVTDEDASAIRDAFAEETDAALLAQVQRLMAVVLGSGSCGSPRWADDFRKHVSREMQRIDSFRP